MAKTDVTGEDKSGAAPAKSTTPLPAELVTAIRNALSDSMLAGDESETPDFDAAAQFVTAAAMQRQPNVPVLHLETLGGGNESRRMRLRIDPASLRHRPLASVPRRWPAGPVPPVCNGGRERPEAHGEGRR